MIDKFIAIAEVLLTCWSHLKPDARGVVLNTQADWKDPIVFQQTAFILSRQPYFAWNGFIFYMCETERDGRAVAAIARIPACYESAYDDVAQQYEALWSTPRAVAEDRMLMDKLKPLLKGRVLDIGCGTGLLLDYCARHIEPIRYTGIDPSDGMLNILKSKHPAFAKRVLNVCFEDFWVGQKYDTIVCLWGGLNYVAPEYMHRIAAMGKPGCNLFLMYFKPGYVPVTHEQLGIIAPTYNHPADGEEFGNYIIVRK